MTIPCIPHISKNTLAMWLACATMAVATSATAAPAQTPGTEPSTRAKPAKADKPAKVEKPAATKARPRTRPTSKAPKTPAKGAAKATSATGNDTRTASAKPSQVMDFDADQVEGQRFEPGFELIEGAPRKARHRSLVEPLKPSDSVVRGE